MDTNYISLGMLLGRQIIGMRKVAVKEPVAYLYNGVRLPKLPVVEGESKAVLADANGVYVVDFFSINLEAYNTGDVFFIGKSMFKYADGQWVKTNWTTYPVGKALWTNFDLYYKTNDSYGELSGALCMAASEPIPVYE